MCIFINGADKNNVYFIDIRDAGADMMERCLALNGDILTKCIGVKPIKTTK